MSFSASFNGHGADVHSVSAPYDGEAGRRVGLRSGYPTTRNGDRVKGFAAATAQSIIRARDEVPRPAPDAPQHEKDLYADAMRSFATALTHLEIASQMATKGTATMPPQG